jgi:ribosomal protein L11 methyltransferase
MTTKSWLQVQLRVKAADVAQAEQALFEAGALSVTLLDAEDHPVHEPGPGEVLLWPELVVQGLFDAAQDRSAVACALSDAELIDDPARLQFEPLADQDWERAWMDQYQPLRFGRDLWICPSHIEPDPDWPLVISLDPGLAFGSGTHPTTALCLEWIDGQDLSDQIVIDFGCGSGILAIACALKGARQVMAVDHDPQALTATADNAQRNGVASRIEGLLPDEFQTRPVDCVLANILAGPLIELASLLSSCVCPSGKLVLSGILNEQAEQVIDAYSQHFRLIEKTRREDWVRLDLSQATG